MASIEIARIVLGDVDGLERPAWRSKEAMLALRGRLQPAIAIDAGVVLRDVWDRIEGAGSSGARVVLRTAVEQVRDGDDLRRLRSIVPGSMVDTMLSRGPSTPLVASDDLADSHVHSGGAVPFPVVMNGLLATDANALVEIVFDVPPQEFGGNDIDIRPLVVGIKLALEHLLSGRRNHPASGWSWPALGALCRRRATDHELHELHGLLDVGIEHRWETVLAAMSVAGGNTHVIDGLVVAACLLNVCLTTSDVASLEIFVDDFSRYPVRTDTFRAAMDWMAPALSRLELRKSFPAVPRDGFAQIEDCLRRFLDAADGHDGTALQMPVGFLKRRSQQAVDPYLLDGQLRLAEQYVDLFTGMRSPLARAVIAALDVAGDEVVQPNFPYVVAFKRIKEMVARSGGDLGPITFSAHAGEAYEHPLGGLRSIGEYLFMGLTVDRVGHGLVLDPERSDRELEALVGVRPQADAALLDLLHCRYMLRRGDNGWRLQDDFLLTALGEQVFGPGHDLTAGLLEEWYRSLFEVAIVEPYRYVPFDGGSSDFTCPLGRGTVDRLLHAFLHPHCVPRGPVARYCDEEIAKDVAAARSHYCPLLRAVVVDRLRHDVVVEVCPTSNCRLGRFSIAAHPIHSLLHEGLECSVSTDDPALFNTTLADEYTLLHQTLLDAPIADLKRTSMRVTAAGVTIPAPGGYGAALARP